MQRPSDDRPKALVIGFNTVDLVFTIDGPPSPDADILASSLLTVPGGTAGNVATTLAGLGVDVQFVGAFADDLYGRTAANAFQAAGVDIAGSRFVAGVDHHVAIVLVDAENSTRLCCSYCPEALRLATYSIDPSWFDGVDVLYTDAHEADFSERAIAVADDRGVRIVSDAESAAVLRSAWILSADDLLLAGDAIPHGETPESAVAELHALGIDTVVATLGAQGAVGISGSGPLRRIDAKPVDVVDTTGAGDAFRAGYVASLLAGNDFEGRIEFGTRVAAQKCRVAGPRLGFSDLQTFNSELTAT